MSRALEKFGEPPKKQHFFSFVKRHANEQAAEAMKLLQWACPITLMPIASDVELMPCRVKGIYVAENLYRRYATDSGLLSSKNALEPQPTHVHYLS